jgi:hypothetical protein
MDQAVVETNASQIQHNCEAQHRYLTWRAEKVIIFLPGFFFHTSHHLYEILVDSLE